MPEFALLFSSPRTLDDYVTDTNPVRVVDVFVDELDLRKLGFEGVEPALTGRPSYHPEVMLKIYIYGYLNRIQSSRRLEREAQRNIELMWLTGRLAPDFKTIAPGSAKTTVKPSIHHPEMMRIRRQTVEHLFGTLKFWMGATHFLMKTREHVSTEMSLHVLAYNLKRVMAILGTAALMQKMRARGEALHQTGCTAANRSASGTRR